MPVDSRSCVSVLLQGVLERQQLDRQRAEEEAADARNALQKVLCDVEEAILQLPSQFSSIKHPHDHKIGATMRTIIHKVIPVMSFS